MSDVAAERESFLPDFCAPGNLLRTVVIAQLLVFILTAAQSGDLASRTQSLAMMTLFVQWVALVDVALLCLARRRLARLDDRIAATAAFVLLQAVTLVFTLLVHYGGALVEVPVVPRALPAQLLEHGVISFIVGAVGLRYFYVTHQWRRNVAAEAEARIQALQARIRPHFLFNSMNTIASLTRSDPVAAEGAVEDLAELFRATLHGERLRPLADEIEFAASYLRIEALRLGGRLRVEWDLEPRAGMARVPALSLQPLVENAVYHGIEARPGGGTIRVLTGVDGARAWLCVRNPVPTSAAAGGHRIAQDNVRERLRLAWGEAGEFSLRTIDGDYEVRIAVPLEASP